VIHRLKDTLQNKPVEINIKDNMPLFKLDQGLMEQVLHNLIYNAALYIPKYAVVSIKATVSKEDYLVIVIEDTGEGFPEDEIEHVFDKFYRLKNSKTGGTGLGLSIVKGFVEAMNGTISLENGDEYGAIFTITIPAEIAHVNDIKNE
jgi:two-component system sensor histidine kinase KdpD